MNKKLKSFAVISCVVLLIFGAIMAILYTTNLNNDQQVDSGYEIISYDVNINVNENNVLNMVETIQVNFKESRHGIYRYIPIINKLTRQNGSKTKTRYTVHDLSIEANHNSGFKSEEYLIERDNGKFLTIRIGEENSVYEGVNTYKIYYNYNLGTDPIKNGDEFYFNIIGNGWNTTIANTTFKITMPKNFDYSEKSLGFYSGEYGNSSSSGIYYSVNNNVISGSLSKVLKPWESLTIRLNLPEGYFVNTSNNNFSTQHIIATIIAVIIGIIALVSYLKVKNKTKYVKTVEFFPPDNLNSLDLAYNYKGKATYADISSLIIYFANHKYLSISESSANPTDTPTYTLNKLKDYDGDNKFEKEFFEYIFDENSNITLDDLIDKTKEKKNSAKIQSIFEKVNSKTNLKESFPSNFRSHKIKSYALSIISFVLLFVPLTLEFTSSFIGAFVASVLITILPCCLIFILIRLKFQYNHIIASKTQLTLLILGGITNIILFFCTSTVKFNLLFLLMVAILIAVNLITMMLIGRGTPRTDKGLKLYGKILGFREFLIKAEKPELERLVNENPNYYFDILPYTYVLGVSDTWIKKFELIPLNNPEWYTSVDVSTFSITRFSLLTSSAITSTGHNFSKHVAESHKSSSGGFSGGGSSGGGGGFSGGGGGGGGGGSW